MNTYETPLSVNQKIEALQRVIELIEYNIEQERDSDLDDTIYEVADTFVSPYYTEQVQQWVEMGAPEPDDWELDQQNDNPIHSLITYAIIQTTTEYLYQAIITTEATNKEAHATLRAELDHLRKARGYAKLAEAIIK